MEIRVKRLCEGLFGGVALHRTLHQGLSSLIALFDVVEVKDLGVPMVMQV